MPLFRAKGGDMNISVYDSNQDGVIAKENIEDAYLRLTTFDPDLDGKIALPQIEISHGKLLHSVLGSAEYLAVTEVELIKDAAVASHDQVAWAEKGDPYTVVLGHGSKGKVRVDGQICGMYTTGHFGYSINEGAQVDIGTDSGTTCVYSAVTASDVAVENGDIIHWWIKTENANNGSNTKDREVTQTDVEVKPIALKEET